MRTASRYFVALHKIPHIVPNRYGPAPGLWASRCPLAPFRRLHFQTQGLPLWSANDPFAVVPFKVPEQFRAFTEMGIFQARDGYQKFKDAAVSNNGALEALVEQATKGAGRFHLEGDRNGPDQH